MVRNKELKAERKNGGSYRIPGSEIKCLAKKLARQEIELDKQFGNISKPAQEKNILYYTVTQAQKNWV